MGLLEVLLFELERMFRSAANNQPYLEKLYKAMFLLGFYGLLRVGEIAKGDHVLKAKDIHIAQNKCKILIVLYSSKTHGPESRPQKICITSLNDSEKVKRFFCPFTELHKYAKIRGGFVEGSEQFFVFQDRSPVLPAQIRGILKTLITRINLDANLYDMHSLRIGMPSQMLSNGFSVDQIRVAGRWKSNAVFRYLCQ